MMITLQYTFLTFGAFFGFLGVAAGAFGAHFLKTRVSSEAFDVFEVAVRYQMYHTLALIGLAVLIGMFPSIWWMAAGWLFILGIIIFSGSLYALVFSGIRLWGAITPIGGLLFLMGWLSLLLGSLLSS